MSAKLRLEVAKEKHGKALNMFKTAANWSELIKTSFVAADILPWLRPTSVTVCPVTHIHFSLPSESVNPFCTPPVHFLWLPPSHLSNGGIVLMDCPKQQRGGQSCHSTSTPPLHSCPLHPSVCNRSGNMHSVFFAFLCLVAQATPSSLKRNSFTWIDQVAGVPCYSVTPNKQQSSHFGQQERILGIGESDLKLAQNLRERALIWFGKKVLLRLSVRENAKGSLNSWRKVSMRREEGSQWVSKNCNSWLKNKSVVGICSHRTALSKYSERVLGRSVAGRGWGTGRWLGWDQAVITKGRCEQI